MGKVNQGFNAARDAFNQWWSGDAGCTTAQQSAYDKLKEASEIASRNMGEACKALAESEVYTSKSVAALGRDMGDAAAWASEVASMQVAKAKSAAIDAWEATNDTK